jgi:DNA repair protein RadC
MRVGVGEEQPLVAVLFFHFSETLVAVATENRPLVEAQLIKPDFLHRKAIALNASSVVLVHAHTWESSPIPTGKEVGLGLNLFNNLRNFGVQLSDHLILGKCDNSTPEIFSFLMHGMLPVRTPEGEWQWGKLRYP